MSAAGFAMNGIQLPFFPVWLDELGFEPWQISLLLALPLLVRIPAAPAILAAADRSRDRALALIAVSLACCVFSAGFLFTSVFWPLLILTILLGIGVAAQVPLTDSIMLSGVRRYGSDYARMRVWGSIAFLAANLAGGYAINAFGAGAVPAILFAGYSVALAISLFVPWLGRPRNASPAPDALLKGARNAFMRRDFLIFVSAVSLVQASHGFLYGFGSIYWRAIGIGETTIGLLWAAGVLAEIVIFFVFRKAFGTTDPRNVLLLGAGMAVLRWLLFPMVESFGLGLAGFLVLQAMHAFTFAAAYLAMQAMVAKTIEEKDLGSAQGVYTFLSSAALALALFLSGPLYKALGGGGYAVMALIAGAGFVLALLAGGPQPQSSRGGGETSDPA